MVMIWVDHHSHACKEKERKWLVFVLCFKNLEHVHLDQRPKQLCYFGCFNHSICHQTPQPMLNSTLLTRFSFITLFSLCLCGESKPKEDKWHYKRENKLYNSNGFQCKSLIQVSQFTTTHTLYSIELDPSTFSDLY